MLLFLVISIILQLTVAAGFFDRCPMDREQLVDNDQVFDVLQTFYNDLIFVRASTESSEDRDFEKVIEEMRSVVPSNSWWQPIQQGIELLREGPIIQAGNILAHAALRAKTQLTPVPVSLRSYMHYFAAEAYRLAGYIGDASNEMKKAISDCTESNGVSLNELERLDGLIVLQRVSNFNQDVEKLYGLNTGSNFEQLEIAHSDLKDKIDPFNNMRHAELDRMFGSNWQITSNLMKREIGAFRRSQRRRENDSEAPDHRPVAPIPDIFNGRSVAKISAEDILCDFALKLAILVRDSREDGGMDYSSLIGQLKQISAVYAEELDRGVVRNLVTENPVPRALDSLTLFDERHAAAIPDHLVKTLETYTNYFAAEIFRITNDCTDILYAEILLDDIKKMRWSERGVSLDKLLELEGRIVIKLIECFRNRLISAYELNGRESEEELEDKRARFGSY